MAEKEFYGWTGKVLDVDLTAGKVETKALDEVCPDYKDYIGGRGLGVKILYDAVGPDTDPLGPENVLVFATGPLTGTSISSSGRFCIVSKSPLGRPAAGKEIRGLIFDSNSGGDWSEVLKNSGFDAIILRGKADSPVYLWVEDGKAEIKDAKDLWGKGCYETTAAIKEESGEPGAKVACIGPAGENLVRVACVINDADELGYGRACGRDGGGAVMGSKNFKAIALKGTLPVAIAKPGEFLAAVREEFGKIRNDPVCGTGLPTYGTAVLNNIINEGGLLPTCNFQWGMFKEATKTGGEAMRGEVSEVPKTLTTTRGCCRTCVMHCARATSIPEELRPDYVTIGAGEGPEYETSWAFGATCGVDDMFAIAEANYLCNELGLDTISAGATIACAFELCEKGILDLSEVGYAKGKSPFSDGEAMVKLVSRIASREGVGDELAEGSKRLADKYGRPELSMSVKGLEFPAYDPRGVLAHGLAYATSNRGACHVRAYLIAAEVLERYVGLSPPDVPEATVEYRLAKDSDKTDLVLIFQNLTAAIDCLDQCLFTVFGIGADDYAKTLSAATGVDYTAEDVLKVGERVWNLERLFNIREGLTKDDDRLPPRLEEEPMPNEIYSAEAKAALTPPVEVPPHGTIEKQPTAGSTCPIPEMLPLYYEKRGWTAEGVPTDAKLEELGLSWAKPA
jgi:aldehyde:ferredoxin oxidoreductase